MEIDMSGYTIIEDEVAYQAAVARKIKENGRKTREKNFRAECPDWEAILTFIEANSANKFWHDVNQGVREYGAPRPKIIEIVRERLAQTEAKKAEWKARDARSEHISEVGKKIEVEAVVTFRTSFEGFYGWVDITGFRVGDNVIIHKGKAPEVPSDEINDQWGKPEMVPVKKGDRVMLKATVKDHGEREGVKQTIVTRPKATLLPKVEG
jgi:hypothetical protein